MVFIRPEEREINFKIVFWGPACSGKTTCLKYLKSNLEAGSRKVSKLTSVDNRTLFFDFLPLKVEKIKGLKTHFHLYTVPGQAPYTESRAILLRGVDGLFTVLDSQIHRGSDNDAALMEMNRFLEWSGEDLAKIPRIFAYNKQDLEGALSLEDMNALYNPEGLPAFSTVATRGDAVMAAFSALVEKVVAAAKQTAL